MSRLEFKFEDLMQELIAAEGTMGPFLDPSSTEILQDSRRQLERIRGLPRDTVDSWRISEERPLLTRTSLGSYEREDEGEHNVVGEVTSIWEIAPSDAHASNKRPAKTFAIWGLASVRVRLREWTNDGFGRDLAMWRMEVGNLDSPGCCFHVQVLGEKGRDHPPFPHSLSIPRLPSLAFTPMAALEFVIGELFQDDWRKHAVRETDAMNSWKGLQRKRLSRLLEWQQAQIESCIGSPWNALKKTFPSPHLFT
jgi:hypothetical protein